MAVAETKKPRPVHQGQNVRRFRELKGMKQDALARELDTTQQNISLIEQSETIDEKMLEKVAGALGVTIDAIKTFNDEAVINIISNTFNDEASAYSLNYKCSFNPIDKIVELYDALLKEKEERIKMLEGKG